MPLEYRKTSLITQDELDKENLFMCDYKVDELLENKNQAIIFPYSRLYCDVERFKDDNESMNKYGMGYIYTKTSNGKTMFKPSLNHKKLIAQIYDKYHNLLNEKVETILKQYNKCIIIDLHSFSDELVFKLFGYKDTPDICIGFDEIYYSKDLVNHFSNYFESNGYSVKLNYPYKGSLVPNKYYGKKDTKIISVMLEINKRVYINDFDNFKEILSKVLEF